MSLAFAVVIDPVVKVVTTLPLLDVFEVSSGEDVAAPEISYMTARTVVLSEPGLLLQVAVIVVTLAEFGTYHMDVRLDVFGFM
jgi:hypothetical protein